MYRFRISLKMVVLAVGFTMFAAQGPVQSARAQGPNLPTKPPQGVTFIEEIVYGKGGGEELTLNLSHPAKGDRKRPCVVVIHGGAWRGGNKKGHNNLTWMFAERGYVSVTVGYRFCPQHRFPAQVEDVKCAVRYLRAHADKYGIDPQRIGAVGFSAGAHLSLMLGVMGEQDGLEGDGGWADQKSQVQAVVSYFGPTALGADDIPEISVPLVNDFIGGPVAEKRDQFRRASPITYVTADDAPMLLYQGTKDPLVPHTQAFKMIDALTEAGVPSRAEILIGRGHGWGGSDLSRTLRDTFAYFDKQLNPATAE